jgi:hypothetical protein
MNNSPLKHPDRSPLLRMVAQGLGQESLAAGGDALATSVTIAPSIKPTAPALLARAHPGGPVAQRQALALYTNCLVHFRRAVRRGQADDDVGAAIAFFIHANDCVLHDRAFAEGAPVALERQFSRIVAHSPQWQRATLKERQSFFEQIALIGVLVAETGAQASGQGPAAIANVRAAARAYVRQLLGVEADAWTIGATGLSLRSAVANHSEALA